MSVKINAVLVCSSLYSFPPARVVLLRRAAPKTLKYRLKWIRYFAIIKRVPILHGQCLTLSGANPGGYLR